MSDYRRDLLDWRLNFLHTYTRLVTTLNYSAIVKFHALRITTAHAKSFSVRSAFTRSCLVTATTMVILLLPCSSPV
jgi:hypothetical protein